MSRTAPTSYTSTVQPIRSTTLTKQSPASSNRFSSAYRLSRSGSESNPTSSSYGYNGNGGPYTSRAATISRTQDYQRDYKSSNSVERSMPERPERPPFTFEREQRERPRQLSSERPERGQSLARNESGQRLAGSALGVGMKMSPPLVPSTGRSRSSPRMNATPTPTPTRRPSNELSKQEIMSLADYGAPTRRPSNEGGKSHVVNSTDYGVPTRRPSVELAKQDIMNSNDSERQDFMIENYKQAVHDQQTFDNDKIQELASSLNTRQTMVTNYQQALSDLQDHSGKEMDKLGSQVRAMPMIIGNYKQAIGDLQMEAGTAKMDAARANQTVQHVMRNYIEAMRDLQAESNREINHLKARVLQQETIVSNYIQAIHDAQVAKRHEVEEVVMNARMHMKVVRATVMAGDEVDWLTAFKAIGAAQDSGLERSENFRKEEERRGSSASILGGTFPPVGSNERALQKLLDEKDEEINSLRRKMVEMMHQQKSPRDDTSFMANSSAGSDLTLMYEIHTQQMRQMMEEQSHQILGLRNDISHLSLSSNASMTADQIKTLKQELEKTKILKAKIEAARPAEIMNAKNKVKATYTREISDLKERNSMLEEQVAALKRGLAEEPRRGSFGSDWGPRTFGY